MIGEYEAKLLDDHSDDFYGLWEFDWQLNTDGFDADRQKRIALLRSLVGAGFIELYFGPFRDAPHPLPLGEALAAIDEPSSWLPPSDAEQEVYYLATSAAGQALLHQRGADG